MNEQTNDPTQLVPFEGIGLCFSGGGYRATFFSLGVISYLNKIQYKGSSLLCRTVAVSSVSGGTLLAVAYSKAAQSPDFDFNKFYKSFYDQFTPKNDKLLERAVNKLENKSMWKQFPYKNRNLINSFALTYSEMEVFKGNFDVYRKPEGTSLKNVCFNSTEFSFGLAFRFQNTGIFGNSPLRNSNSEKLKYQLQLGDIVASSSCFPLGFEPLIFPDDYISDQTSPEYIALKKEDYFKNGIGVMDGGIADNQGIESMLNISKRKDVKDRFNLLIVNDVSSYKMAPWVEDTEPISNKNSLRRVLQDFLGYFGVSPIYWILLVLGIAITILNWQKVFGNPSISWLYVLGGILAGSGLVLVILGTIVSTIKNKGKKWIRGIVKRNVPEVLLNDVLSFQKLDIGLLKKLLTNRLTSAAKMINSVFLKQIRRLNYDILYSNDDLENKRITSTVYQLNGEPTIYGNNPFNKDIEPKPSDKLTKASLNASQTPTTLWWDEEDIKVRRMDSLIACGQFTTCYNLLDYVLDLETKGYGSPEITELKKALIEDWTLFNKNPFFMV